MPAVIQRLSLKKNEMMVPVEGKLSGIRIVITEIGSLFVVHRSVDEKGWTVTHRSTSYAIRFGLSNKKTAIMVALAIEEKFGHQFSMIERPGDALRCGLTRKDLHSFIDGLLK